MEYSPPPLFKQGASARAKVVIFSIIAITLLIADSRLHTLAMIRQAVGTVLYPLQRLALMPRDAAYGVGDYFSSLNRIETENDRLKRQQLVNAQVLQQAQLISAENAQLRKLLGASEQLPVKSLLSEILYDARDAFTRKIVLDRGTRHGVVLGQPVIDDTGVVGQVTRVFPFTSETTLLTDKDQAIPVQVVRSGLRSVAYGRGQSGVLDLRFMAANADIQKGDMLVTSGIDGVYPPGLAVARVLDVEHKSQDAFARIVCQPAAGIDRNRQLLILLTESRLPPRPPEAEAVSKKPAPKGQSSKATANEAKPAAAQDGAPAKPLPPNGAAAPPAPPAGAAVKASAAAVTAPVKPAANQSGAPAMAPATRSAVPAPAQQVKPATGNVTPVVNRPAAVPAIVPAIVPAARTAAPVAAQPVKPGAGAAIPASASTTAGTPQNNASRPAPVNPPSVRPAAPVPATLPQNGAVANPAAVRPTPPVTAAPALPIGTSP